MVLYNEVIFPLWLGCAISITKVGAALEVIERPKPRMKRAAMNMPTKQMMRNIRNENPAIC